MKNNDWKDRLNVVYSTNPDFNYDMDDDQEQVTLDKNKHHRTGRFQTESDRPVDKRRIYKDQRSRRIMKKGGNHQSSALLYYLFEIDYSAFRVKRLKSRTFSSGSAAANTSLTVFLASIISSWFSRQTSFKNLPRRPLAMF